MTPLPGRGYRPELHDSRPGPRYAGRAQRGIPCISEMAGTAWEKSEGDYGACSGARDLGFEIEGLAFDEPCGTEVEERGPGILHLPPVSVAASRPVSGAIPGVMDHTIDKPNYFLVFVFDASDFAVFIPVSVKRTAVQLRPSKSWTRARC
jgi:hypothetical protein